MKEHFMNEKCDFRERALPPATSEIDSDEYKNVEIDLNASEHIEPLVDLARFGIRSASFYGDDSGLNAPVHRAFVSGLKRVYARVSVARKLREVNKMLAQYGVAVAVIDGFRPIAVQQELWSWMLEQAKNKFPAETPEIWEAYALRYASNPSNFSVVDSSTWPTHATGGAVDLTLEELDSRRRLFMGSVYLDASSLSSTRYFEELEGTGCSSHIEALRNRRLLYWAMTSAGFVNYAFEWWHFDLLTQASIMNLGMPAGAKACYGLANKGASPEV
jgi:D-alanyl-D-alanine dipeptidase